MPDAAVPIAIPRLRMNQLDKKVACEVIGRAAKPTPMKTPMPI